MTFTRRWVLLALSLTMQTEVKVSQGRKQEKRRRKKKTRQHDDATNNNNNKTNNNNKIIKNIYIYYIKYITVYNRK